VFVVEALGALAAKVAAASTVSQAVAGLGIAVAGVLPPPVQDVVAGAVEVVSPFDLPDSADAADASETDDSGTDSPDEAEEQAREAAERAAERSSDDGRHGSDDD
jgi:hypothetical protein